MSVRITTLCILLGTLLGLTAVIGVGAYHFTRTRATDLEDYQMRRALLWVEQAWEQRTDSLCTIARDWGAWDTAYRFVTAGDPLFVRENFTALTLASLQVTHVALFDRAGALRARYGAPLPPEMLVLARTTAGAACHGLLRTADDVLLVAASPILRSDGSGPVAGTLVMTRTLSVEHPARTWRFPEITVAARRWDDARALSGFTRAAPALTQQAAMTCFPLSARTMVGFLRQDDLLGHPALVLRVERDRAQYHRDMHLFWLRMLVIFALCLLGSLLAVILLDRLVLSRLTRLHGQMRVIAAERNFAARVMVSGRDEVAGLASGVNDMLEALQQAEAAAVAREHAFLVTAFDTLPFPMAIVTPDYEIVYGNTAMRRMLSRLPDHDLCTVTFLDPVTRTVIPLDRQPMARALAGEAYPSTEAVIEIGEDDWLHILAMAGCVQWGSEPAAVVIAIQDITELKHADKEKDEFLAVLSHELMTPLTSILGWAEMAAARPDAVPPAQLLGVVLRNARRQKRLVDDLLDMSRLMHRKLALEPAPLDLRKVTEECVENLAQDCRARGVDVTLTWDAETLPVHGDGIRLQQAIGNLLHNAMKFTEAGGKVEVNLSRAPGGTALLSVADTGIGIEQEFQKRVFDKFFQVDNSLERRYEGAGIGLSIAKSIAEAHGGDIELF
ncbi:MAG TPA: CHASE4 domain-containing protein, partial [Armatimonadota bacterium]|nr:CHASE4 domain-containing protein [Armatimonadota bacterium]